MAIIVISFPVATEEEQEAIKRVRDLAKAMLDAIPANTSGDVVVSAISCVVEVACHRLDVDVHAFAEALLSNPFKCPGCPSCTGKDAPS